MALSETEKKVIQIIKEKISVDESVIEKAKSFEDLGADSLDLVEIVMEIEETFDIEITDEEAENVVNFEQVVKLIKLKK